MVITGIGDIFSITMAKHALRRAEGHSFDGESPTTLPVFRPLLH